MIGKWMCASEDNVQERGWILLIWVLSWKDFWCPQCFVTHLKRQHFLRTQSKFIWRYDLLCLSVLDIADIGFIIFSVDLKTKSIFPTKCNVMKNGWNVSASSLLPKNESLKVSDFKSLLWCNSQPTSCRWLMAPSHPERTIVIFTGECAECWCIVCTTVGRRDQGMLSSFFGGG